MQFTDPHDNHHRPLHPPQTNQAHQHQFGSPDQQMTPYNNSLYNQQHNQHNPTNFSSTNNQLNFNPHQHYHPAQPSPPTRVWNPSLEIGAAQSHRAPKAVSIGPPSPQHQPDLHTNANQVPVPQLSAAGRGNLRDLGLREAIPTFNKTNSTASMVNYSQEDDEQEEEFPLIERTTEFAKESNSDYHREFNEYKDYNDQQSHLNLERTNSMSSRNSVVSVCFVLVLFLFCFCSQEFSSFSFCFLFFIKGDGLHRRVGL